MLFVNIPIGVAAIAAALTWLTESRGHQGAGQPRSRLDVAGAIAVTAGLGTLVYAIVGTETHPWGSVTTLSLLGVAAVLLAVFAIIELRLASAPLVRFSLFRSRSVSGANLVMFLVGAAFFSMWYFLSLYLQNVLGYSALKTGLAFLPMGVTIIIGAQASSRIMPRTGVRPLLLTGTVLAAGGFAWLSADQPGQLVLGARVRARLPDRARSRPAVHAAGRGGDVRRRLHRRRTGLGRAQHLAADRRFPRPGGAGHHRDRPGARGAGREPRQRRPRPSTRGTRARSWWPPGCRSRPPWRRSSCPRSAARRTSVANVTGRRLA